MNISDSSIHARCAVATALDKNNPSAGRKVEVKQGRKFKGQQGIVLKQIQDAYNPPRIDIYNPFGGITKTLGYVSLVKFECGTETWIKSHYLAVVPKCEYKAVNHDHDVNRSVKWDFSTTLLITVMVEIASAAANEDYDVPVDTVKMFARTLNAPIIRAMCPRHPYEPIVIRSNKPKPVLKAR
jgi:hypothetical protein